MLEIMDKHYISLGLLFAFGLNLLCGLQAKPGRTLQRRTAQKRRLPVLAKAKLKLLLCRGRFQGSVPRGRRVFWCTGLWLRTEGTMLR